MKQKLQSILLDFMGKENDGLSSKLAGNAFGTFSLKILGTGLSFLLSIVLARALGGSGGYGIYAYGTAWLTLLSVPTKLGMERLMVRKASGYKATGNWGMLKGLLYKSIQYVSTAGISVALIMTAVFYVVAPDEDKRMIIWLALIGLPFLSLRATFVSALRGLNRVWLSQIPAVILYPGLILLSVLVVELTGVDLTPNLAILINVSSIVCSLILAIVMLRRFLPVKLRDYRSEYDLSDWVRVGIPMLLIATLQNMHRKLGVLMLGAYGTDEMVGVFAVCNRGTELINFPLMAINLALAPVIAGMYAKGQMGKMQKILHKAAKATLIGSVPITIGLMALSSVYLILFGKDFLTGQTALLILCCGQLMNVFMGSVGVVLGMTKHERFMVFAASIGLVVNLVLSFTLIPTYGLEGAAIATAASTVSWNLIMLYGVFRFVGVNPTIFAKP
ncbi:MAG: flippase [Bacteroidota bacterium]